ncbi:hypothetical protein TREMEDRAFT_65980 [Tremella mesenterica DSM 1558]|uniref:uncharacterized protein n=1 Tax=Tremella mesenterica (strain ATCC 24925 / CBS 8224 / DSM 1558 / NBRC 9311 / NRRL Y-6157 / RJB 2259-6 / UBC 559-6) TaxID=578456 RepID=UPI00032C9E7B|nr:uncharacterized protein TREMEDRAFT_65980 [Tremella mesenterica DSM 1558]EIW65895.1 hypothetical protein TREMEDRAFT_65980 [Tremella mesenterica DSM 1558]
MTDRLLQAETGVSVETLWSGGQKNDDVLRDVLGKLEEATRHAELAERAFESLDYVFRQLGESLVTHKDDVSKCRIVSQPPSLLHVQIADSSNQEKQTEGNSNHIKFGPSDDGVVFQHQRDHSEPEYSHPGRRSLEVDQDSTTTSSDTFGTHAL